MTDTFPRLQAPAGDKPKSGIVHLGLGAFFRAHGAIYIAEAMAKSGGDWGIIGVSLVRPTQRDLLKPQGFAYTALELAPEGENAQVISVINDVLVARENPTAVIDAMAAKTIKIVSLTVTEKGYCYEPSTGALNLDHPDIAHDIANPDAPKSALGFVVAALAKRRAKGLAPFTVLSCDNLPENGKLVRGVTLALAERIDPALAKWIASEGAFPSTMVDRIVPATKPEDITRVATLTGFEDRSPVIHEPFRQWVIEDNFVNNDRPDLAAVGAQLVADVTPFEHMKLRCLNGTHSSLAYLGYLGGYETISDTVANADYAALCRYLWQSEIIPGLTAPKGADLPAYAEQLLVRYQNPSIRHLTWQIAMDGSQKLPQRLLETISENVAANRPYAGLALAVAAWMRYVGGVDEQGKEIDVRDPFAERLKTLSDGANDPSAKVDALLAVTEIFPATLAGNAGFRQTLVDAYTGLIEKGARSCVADLVK